MLSKATQEENDDRYARLCIDQIEMLSLINKTISSKDMTEKHIDIIHNNISLMIRLKDEYDKNI